MTNKEDIKFLKEIRMWKWLNVAQEIAIDMAIDALSQEPCDDCISRQAVLDIIEKEPFKGDAIAEIENLPSVTPKEKTGHWEVMSSEICKCSKCKLFSDKVTKFCPNCGAKMQEVEDGNK